MSAYPYNFYILEYKYQSVPQGVVCYTIDSNGNIDFPLLGTIEAAGMTREQLAVHIKQEMLDKK